MRRILTAILILVPCLMAIGQPRPQTLSYSRFVLRLGAEQGATLESLRSRFKFVVEVEKNERSNIKQYIVQKENKEIVGVVTFMDGTLSKAYRDWTPSDMSGYEVARAIQGVVEVMKAEGPCELGTGTVKEPGYLNENSTIVCGRKYIEITALESSQMNPKDTVTVYEWLDDGRTHRK
jgi:hypothetical protein